MKRALLINKRTKAGMKNLGTVRRSKPRSKTNEAILLCSMLLIISASQYLSSFSLLSIYQETIKQVNEGNEIMPSPHSPACHPHFKLALPNNQWSNIPKFKRIYFYHSRKAGGTSIGSYFHRMAKHYGLEFKAVEYGAMEEPGTFNESTTFYVTHLREPVARAISHFKYEGRWECWKIFGGRNITITEDNAESLETWNQTGGHVPHRCQEKDSKPYFSLKNCAVNCYTQWLSGLSCPQSGVPLSEQYQVAKSKILKYNFIVVIEKLRDPDYVKSVEDFFGFPGVTNRARLYCEAESKAANEKYPLVVRNDTRKRLEKLNEVDIRLYSEMTGCLENGQYNFSKWDPNRFDLNMAAV